MHVRRARSRLTVASAVLLVPAAMIFTAPPASAAPQPMAKIAGTYPNWLARTKALRASSAAAKSSTKLSVKVYLTPKGGQAALVAEVDALSDPTSPDYGHFLTVAQFQAAYEPTKASASTVSTYLRSKGLKVTGVEAHRRYVSAQGTVKQLDKAFHVSLRSYSHDGQRVTAPAAAAELPAAVAGSVLTVSGLDTTTTTMTHRQTPKATVPPAGFVNARPCSINFGDVAAKYQADFKTPLPKFDGKVLPYAPCGYTGPQLRDAYEGATNALDGAGATVAITDAYRWQFIAQDAERYATEHGDGSYAPGQLSESLPKSYNSEKDCDPSGWSGEETLDVEAVHAMAPAANIRYYASASCNDDDFLDTLARVVQDNKAQIVSNSWGDAGETTTADAVLAYNQVMLQGAAQGISFLFSSGDDGDELANTKIKQADFPATLPTVTAVGGTATGIVPKADGSFTKLFSAGWGTERSTLATDAKSWTSTGFQYGAGGGYSTLFNQPSYQKGVVPASAPAGRAVPDIAMDADPNTGMLVGQTQTFKDSVHYGEYRIGGTSLASPLLAGMTALAVQNHKSGFGLLNPKLYATKGLADDVVAQPKYLGVVRADYTVAGDVTSPVAYTVRTFGQDSSLPVVKGWDPVTGIGVPNVSFFAKLSAAATPKVAATTTGR